MPDALVRKLLVGAVSYHDHYGWERGGGQSQICRKTYDPVLIVQSAADAGMIAVCLRNLYFNSAGDAYLVKKLVPGIDVIGGIFLNSDIGGINPRAVDTAMTYGTGAKFVCMATDDSAHQARQAGVDENTIYNDPVRYVTPFERSGKLKDSMKRVLDTIAHYDVLLETGSLNPEENLKIVEAAQNAGVKKIVVTHPTPWFCNMSIPEMQQAIAMGAYIEFTWMFFTHSISYMQRKYGSDPHTEPQHPEDIGKAFDQIRALGADHCLLSTDFGTLELPLPVEGLREFVFCLLDLDMAEGEIKVMIQDNPAMLLGLRK